MILRTRGRYIFNYKKGTMKKKLVLLFIVLASFSCSKDDNPEEVKEVKYKAGITAKCPDGVRVEYYVRKTTYDNLYKIIENPTKGCNWASFIDEEGKNVSGYLTDLSEGM